MHEYLADYSGSFELALDTTNDGAFSQTRVVSPQPLRLATLRLRSPLFAWQRRSFARAWVPCVQLVPRVALHVIGVLYRRERQAYRAPVPQSAEPFEGYCAERYFEMAKEGLIAPDERSELLEGMIVAMVPQAPLHAAAVRRVDRALRKVLGDDVLISVQLPLIASARSVPEPDVAVLSGSEADYVGHHPTTALLVVEVADRSLSQDRLTKAAIYTRAGVADYWIVNLRDGIVEWYSAPDANCYTRSGRSSGETLLHLTAFPGVFLAARELFPADRA